MKKKSLNMKLVMGGILIVFIPLLIVGAFAAMKAASALETAAKDQATHIARNLTEMVQGTLQEEMKLAGGLAADKTIVEATAKVNGGADAGESLQQHLQALGKTIGSQYEVILAIDMTGKAFADSAGGTYKGLSFAERDYFKEAKTGKASPGQVIKSKVSHAPVVAFGVPVLQDKQTVGVLATVLKTEAMAEKISSIKIGKTGYAWMADQNGLIIAHPKKELILELNVAKEDGMREFVSKLLAKKTGADDYVFKGVPKIAGYAPVMLTGWGIGVTQDTDEFLAPAHHIRNIILIVGVIFLLVTGTGVYFFSKGISRPIEVSVNDLNEAAQQVSSASSQVSSASQALAEGASESASSIEETSASLEEITSMTRQNAGNAQQANQMMAESMRVIDRANESMKGLTFSMNEISRASEETSKIIKTIDEIAFQTNLLALNAAVEAARAGEAGAGFAVVAEEVRNLAIRAADAAKNTSGLIEDTVKKIKGGSEVVGKASTEFAEVASSAKKVNELIAEISAASEEQTRGIEQISKAITELDKVTQQNAATAEESASAAEEMNAQSEQMKGVVNGLVAVIGSTANGAAHSAAEERAPATEPALWQRAATRLIPQRV